MYHLVRVTLLSVSTLLLIAAKALGQTAPQQFDRIMFYNIENLYDTIDDPTTDDKEFLPTAEGQWTAERYHTKLVNLGKVIETAGFPALVGMCEVENKTVLNDLVRTPTLSAKNYSFIHFDSPDERGVDVALIYRSDRFTVLSSKVLPVVFEKEPEDKTRDILYVKGLLHGETIHVFVNHWPSRREGEEQTRHRRIAAGEKLKHEVDSILAKDKNAQIVIMGDLNDYPGDKSITEGLKALNYDAKVEPKKIYDLSGQFPKDKGTYKYKGEWGMLDHIMVSTGFLAEQGVYTQTNAMHIAEYDYLLSPDPKGGQWLNRTYAGPKYLGGYSDHLPVYLDLFKK